MSNCWVVLVHPYHDYLIDVAVFTSEALAVDHKGRIEEAQRQRHQLFGSGIDAYNAGYDAQVTKWTPLIGGKVASQLQMVEYVDVEEREIR
jgi:hypothetical protein